MAVVSRVRFIEWQHNLYNCMRLHSFKVSLSTQQEEFLSQSLVQPFFHHSCHLEEQRAMIYSVQEF